MYLNIGSSNHNGGNIYISIIYYTRNLKIDLLQIVVNLYIYVYFLSMWKYLFFMISSFELN